MNKRTPNSLFIPSHTSSVSVRTWLLRFLLCIFCAILPKTSHAYTTELIQHLKNNNTNTAYQWLKANEHLYANDPNFNEWLAQLALLRHQYPQAINALERLILLKPNHIGARLDLTLAYYKTGEIREARDEFTHLKAVLAHIDIVPQSVNELMQQMAINLARPTNTATRIINLAVTAGYDNNSNLATDAESITLNLQGQIPIELYLAPESTATPDSFIEEHLQFSLAESPDRCQQQWCYALLGNISARQYQTHTTYSRRHGLLGGLVRKQAQGTHHQWITYAQYQEPNERDALSILALEYSRQNLSTPSMPGFRLHADYRHNQHDKPDSQYLAASLFTDKAQRWSYNLNVGYHRQPMRNAGNTFRAQASSSHNMNIAQWTLRHTASIIIERDAHSYSEFLFGSTRRKDTRFTLSASASRPLTSRWQLSLNLRYSQNKSSIPLLNHNRLEAQSTLSYLW
ncbi:hypothetical protein IOQ59_01600 [Pontibacterium sp. N1Y112]|uniref:DUF560 domain-containing protein n=1 Tax=Pontibacterium sinense TaxID=2781979 RepID=A0A8J7FEX4_9GAMM|nr:tetratricopeptide repeat protein [Pontibacterium sinense]MBE9395948.1 hypothetical protein [Pontibacterium sinense]